MELSLLVARRVLYQRSLCKTVGISFSHQPLRQKQQLSVHEDQQQVKIPSKLSTLYVLGRYGADIYQIVKPLIDVNSITKNIDVIKSSCHLRGIEINCDNLIDSLEEWKNKSGYYSSLVDKNKEYLSELERLKSSNLSAEHKACEKEYFQFIEILKESKEKLHEAEEVAFPLVQLIPNNIDRQTPLEADVVEVISTPPSLEVPPLSHVEIGKNFNLLKFLPGQPPTYYLTGTLADLEVAVQNYFYEKLQGCGYAPISCVDFCKSFIVEAIGLDPYSPHDCIQLKSKNPRDTGQKLNLVGGASFESFCAYLVNMITGANTLPAKYFSFGRRYSAKHRQSENLDLFSVVQSTNFHCCTLCDVSKEDEEFNSLFELMLSFYHELRLPFRVCNVHVKNLNRTESRKREIQLWSPCQEKYIPVAYVSQHGDFISKRLNITYGDKYIVEGYCCIVEGVAINIPVIIGCIVEKFQRSHLVYDFPDELKFLQHYI